MRKNLLFFLLLTPLLSSAHKVFVKTKNGYDLKAKLEKCSIHDCTKSAGFNTEAVYHYNGDYDPNRKGIWDVCFKLFSKEVLFVITTNNVTEVTEKQVKDFLKDFNYEEEQDSYSISYDLKAAIKDKKLNNDDFSFIFGCNVPANGEFIASKIAQKLKFKNRYLVSFVATDGYNTYARSWKDEQPEVFKAYYDYAQKVHGSNEEEIKREINIQAEAFACKVIDGGQNEYIKYHTPSGMWIVNFKMLAVAHYGDKITLSEFKRINKGRYIFKNEYNGNDGYKRTTYKINKCLVTFNENGELENTYVCD